MSVPAETFSLEQHQPNGVEMDADKALAIAEQANLALESLDGAMGHTLSDGDSITFDPRSLEAMGEHGPVALILAGSSLVKLYAFNDGSNKRYAVAHADFYNDMVEDRMTNVGHQVINGPTAFGSKTGSAGELGLAGDKRVAGSHFVVDADDVQIRITDESRIHRDKDTKLVTYVIAKEKQYSPDNVVDIVHAKHLGRRLVPKVLEDK